MQLQPEAFFFKGEDIYFFDHDAVNDYLSAPLLATHTGNYTIFMAFYYKSTASANSLFQLSDAFGATGPKIIANIQNTVDVRTFQNGRGYTTYAGAIISDAMNYVAISRDLAGTTELLNINGTAFSGALLNTEVGTASDVFSYSSFGGFPSNITKELSMVNRALDATELAALITAETLDEPANNVFRIVPSYKDNITTLDPTVVFSSVAGGLSVTINGKPNPMVLGVDLVKL